MTRYHLGVGYACVIMFVLLLLPSTGCGSDCIKRDEAGGAAHKAMVDFASLEHIDSTGFGEPEVRFQEPEKVWMVNYTHRQRNLLTVIVGCGGGVEISSLPPQ